MIRNNRERKEKRLWTENAAGEPVTYFTGVTERDEADFIAREIGRLTAEGGHRPGRYRGLLPGQRAGRVIEEALVRRRVPYYVVGGLRFYEHREVKDLLAYLRVLANPADAVSVERMVGAPTRGVGGRDAGGGGANRCRGRRHGRSRRWAAWRPTRAWRSVRPSRRASCTAGCTTWPTRAPSMKVRAILDEVIARAGFLSYLDAMPDGAPRRQNVAEMLSAADAFDAEGQNGGLADFLERVALVSDADQVAGRGGRAALMTLHTSKGLEYPVVFIAGMEEGLFPHIRSQDDGQRNRGGAPAAATSG